MRKSEPVPLTKIKTCRIMIKEDRSYEKTKCKHVCRGGGGPAEPVLSKQYVLADDVKSNAKGGVPAAERHPQLNLSKILAFTMAEILLSLTIIGVVAAITLPSLTGNINERTWNTQRKALYARFSQAIALMPALNGYGALTEDESGSVIEDTAAETFVTAGLSKVLKINNICGDKFEDCGFPIKVIGINNEILDPFPTELKDYNPMMNGSISIDPDGAYSSIQSYSMLTGKGAAFETANGESMVVFYNPYCSGSMNETQTYLIQHKMCANFIYDLNGKKGPNTVNKDIGFITVLYPTDSVVAAPVLFNKRPVGGTPYWAMAGKLCTQQSEEGRLPTAEEAMSLFYNRRLIFPETDEFNFLWTSTTLTNNPAMAWYIDITTGTMHRKDKETTGFVFCIKRNKN